MDPGTVPFWRTFMRHLFFGDLGPGVCIPQSVIRPVCSPINRAAKNVRHLPEIRKKLNVFYLDENVKKNGKTEAAN